MCNINILVALCQSYYQSLIIEKVMFLLFHYILQVHHGFYNAYHNTTMRPGVIDGIKQAKKLFGDIDVIVIGHSMGGAMAAICALDLKVFSDSFFFNVL